MRKHDLDNAGVVVALESVLVEIVSRFESRVEFKETVTSERCSKQGDIGGVNWSS